MFKNIYTRENLQYHVTPPGDEYRIERGWYYKDGEMVYGEKGITNVYEKIQAQADSVDLHAIVKRYENGDKTALDRVQGMYIDTVDLPKNYTELYDSIDKANRIFDSMPAEIKAKYNNSAPEFWKNYGKEQFDDVINAYRRDELSRYGMIDETPINSVQAVKDMNIKSDTVVEKPVVTPQPVVESEVTSE